MPTTFPVLLANGFIELGALAVDGTLNAVTASWAMMIDWLRTGVQGDDVTRGRGFGKYPTAHDKTV